MSALARRVDKARSLARLDPPAGVEALDALRREFPKNPRPLNALRALVRDRLPTLLPPAAEQARSGDWPGAMRVLRPLAAADPSNPGLSALAASGLIATGRPTLALSLLKRARKYSPKDPSLAGLEGTVRRELGDSDGALAALEAALAIDPGHAASGNTYGLALMDLGDKTAAVAAWRRVLAANPRAADTWTNAAPHLDFAGDPALLEALEAAAALPRLTPAERECLDFARAEAALQLGDGETAFARLARANAARRKSLGYNPDKQRLLFDEIRARFGDLTTLDAPASGPRPILITGLPRSGTTLTEQVLAAHPMVHAAGELDALTIAIRPHLAPDEPAGNAALPTIANAYRASLAALTAETVITDKMPLNFRWIGPVLAALPEARVIHITRDPMAVGLSLYRHRFTGTGNGFAYGLRDIAAFTHLERGLMDFWRERWGPDRLLDLDYNALTADPETQIRRILDFAGLPFDPACLEPQNARRTVRTASAAQVIKPIYKGSTDAWRKWETHLAPLADALGTLTPPP